MAYGVLSVLVTATSVPAGGAETTVYNNGLVAVYRGDDSSVTTSTGVPINPGGAWTFRKPSWLIAASTCECRWISE